MWCSASFGHAAESRHSAGNTEHTPEHLIDQSHSFSLIWFPRLLHRAVGQEATMFQWIQPSPWKQTAALSVLSDVLSPGFRMFACTKLIKNFLWHVSHPFYYSVAFYLHTSMFFRDFLSPCHNIRLHSQGLFSVEEESCDPWNAPLWLVRCPPCECAGLVSW